MSDHAGNPTHWRSSLSQRCLQVGWKLESWKARKHVCPTPYIGALFGSCPSRDLCPSRAQSSAASRLVTPGPKSSMSRRGARQAGEAGRVASVVPSCADRIPTRTLLHCPQPGPTRSSNQKKPRGAGQVPHRYLANCISAPNPFPGPYLRGTLLCCVPSQVPRPGRPWHHDDRTPVEDHSPAHTTPLLSDTPTPNPSHGASCANGQCIWCRGWGRGGFLHNLVYVHMYNMYSSFSTPISCPLPWMPWIVLP